MTQQIPLEEIGETGCSWWFLAKVLNVYGQEGLTISEVKKYIVQTLDRIHRSEHNPRFMFFLGYQTNISDVLERMVYLRWFEKHKDQYGLSLPGRKILAQREQALRDYTGIKNLDALMKD